MLNKLSYLISGSIDVYHNQAIEELLLSTVAQDECILYLWQNNKTVVLGRNQNARVECNLAALAEDGGHIARRLSGGGAVYHDMGNLNFTFVMPKSEYNLDKQLNTILAAVRALGIRAEKSGRNDITASGRKFSGNAFYKTAHAAYHHGTLMIASDLSALAGYLTVSREKLESKGVASVSSRVVNLNQLRAGITVDAVKPVLIDSFGSEYGLPLRPFDASRFDTNALSALTRKFAGEDWILGAEPIYSFRNTAHFAWGSADLRVEIVNDIIQNPTFYTDALDESLSFVVCDALTGERADAGLTQRLTAAHPEQSGIFADIAGLLQELCTRP